MVDGSLGQRISASLAKVKDGSLSQVFEHVNDGKRAVLLILVSEPRRKADFDSVKEIALFRAYRERLLVDAKIDVIEDPSLAQEEETFSPLKSLLKTIAPDFASRMMAKSKEKEKETNHLANLPPQNQVLIRARMGKKADLYLLGTYAERGVSPSTNGLEEALELYRKAAEKGHDDAMGRLAELYRLGRGIERDKAKAKEWRKKAAAAFMKN